MNPALKIFNFQKFNQFLGLKNFAAPLLNSTNLMQTLMPEIRPKSPQVRVKIVRQIMQSQPPSVQKMKQC